MRRKIFRTAWRVAVALLGVAVFAAVITTDFGRNLGSLPFTQRSERVTNSSHWHDGHFVNAEPTSIMKPADWPGTFVQMLRGSPDRTPQCPLPLVDGAPVFIKPPDSGVRITWLGHSSTVIEIDGHAVLTDPMFSERASPSNIAGPVRFHPVPIALSGLPKLDAVLISHDHYDHLDRETVVKLASLGLTFHVGLGVGAHLVKWGVPVGHIIEHDWWEPTELNGLTITSVPARHFSGRAGLGNDRTLWTSWVVAGATHKVYFSGDTGLHDGLTEIKQKLGPFDAALIEIGQYHPTWGSIHLGPIGALEAQARLGARTLVPIHWSTFVLGLHDWSEPAETLFVEAAKRGQRIATPKLGEPIEPDTAVTSPWWRLLKPYAAQCPKE